MTALFLLDVRVDPVSSFSWGRFDCPAAFRLCACGEFSCGTCVLSALVETQKDSRSGDTG